FLHHDPRQNWDGTSPSFIGRFAGLRATVEDMNRAMAWNIAGVGRRTRDAAVEAARRAGMRLDDWLDEAIADYAALDLQRAPYDEAEDARLTAAAGRLERIARRNASTPGPAPRRETSDPFNSVIGRIEDRLARAEGQAARAFETVAQILERD